MKDGEIGGQGECKAPDSDSACTLSSAGIDIVSMLESVIQAPSQRGRMSEPGFGLTRSECQACGTALQEEQVQQRERKAEVEKDREEVGFFDVP